MMRIFMLLSAALFPFLHATSYEAKLADCSAQEIQIESEGSRFAVSLFNTGILDKKGEELTCHLLRSSASIRFEIDPSTKIEDPLPVYLFADDQLVQAELMERGYAYPLIRNPEYTYEKELEEAYGSTQAMAFKEESKGKKPSYPFQGPLFLGIVFVIWAALLLLLLRGRKRKNMTRKKKSMVK